MWENVSPFHTTWTLRGHDKFKVLLSEEREVDSRDFPGSPVVKPGARNTQDGTSLAVQWLRICLPMQGVRV